MPLFTNPSTCGVFLMVAAVHPFFVDANSLWQDLYVKCAHRVSFYCVQNTLMDYINVTLDSDLHVIEGIYFVKKDHWDPSTYGFVNSTEKRNRYERAANSLDNLRSNEMDAAKFYEQEEEQQFGDFVETMERIEDTLEGNTNTSESEPRIEDEESKNGNYAVRSLHGVTDILYDRATNYLISHDLSLELPHFMFGKSKLVVSPRGLDDDGGILLKFDVYPLETPRSGFIKYFKKKFKKKLLKTFLALIVILKLIKIKLIYVLPIVIGVNAAKKVLLKTMLFLFPPLVHLFKLCTFYHNKAAKFHFHHHKVKHHHHHIKVPVPVTVSASSHKPHYEVHGGPDAFVGSGPIILDHEHDHPPHQHHDSPLTYGIADYYPRNDNEELANWGFKDSFTSSESPGVLSSQTQALIPYVLHPEASFNQPLKNMGLNYMWKTKLGKKNIGVKSTVLVPFDSYYSPILQKIDGIFQRLGFFEEGCRERLICSMYKDPVRFAPHSNLLSSELSREPSELAKPLRSSTAAIRFYRYVEAARNGQSQNDCLVMYPECLIKTE